MSHDAARTRVWRPEWPCPWAAILRQQRHGGGDPTYRVDAAGRHWRGIRTPAGPATLCLSGSEVEVEATAWGPGADWALESVPGMLGALDDVSSFEPLHPLVAESLRHRPHWRFGRTGLVMEALVPAIIEQKVTGQEAFAGFRMMVHRFGTRAPGPGAEQRLWLQPTPAELRRIPSWEWLKLHIDPARSRAIVTVARVAESLERLAPADADAKLRTIPGIGEWTSAEARVRAFGDPDAVSFGDYHVAKDIGWAVTGTPFDDDELREFLEPWRPQRNRAALLIHAHAGGRPRRGPRMAPRRHLPADVTRKV